jgi:hypothetical protein
MSQYPYGSYPSEPQNSGGQEAANAGSQPPADDSDATIVARPGSNPAYPGYTPSAGQQANPPSTPNPYAAPNPPAGQQANPYAANPPSTPNLYAASGQPSGPYPSAPAAGYNPYNPPATPVPPGDYDPTVLAQPASNPSYPGYNPPSAPQATPYASPNPPSGPQANPYAPPSGPQVNPYTGPNPPSGPQANPYSAPNPPSGQPLNSGTQYPAYNLPSGPQVNPYTAPNPPSGQPVGSGVNYPGYNPPSAPQVGYAQSWPGTPLPPQQPPARKRSNVALLLGVVIALILVIGGIIMLVLYNNNTQAMLRASATATADARVNAQASATANTKATAIASATAVASTFPFSNNVVLKDQLADASMVSQYGWDSDDKYCIFTNGSYNARDPQPNTYVPCGAKLTNFANFTFQIQMTFQIGDSGSEGGIFFRGDVDKSQYYIFLMDQQGNYALYVENNSKSNNSRTLRSGQVSAANFNPGFNSVNTIAVVANGDKISMYVNDKTSPIFQVSDTTYSSGQIGVLAATDAKSRTVVTYNAAEVWKLP